MSALMNFVYAIRGWKMAEVPKVRQLCKPTVPWFNS